jgi:hypothetical protein
MFQSSDGRQRLGLRPRAKRCPSEIMLVRENVTPYLERLTGTRQKSATQWSGVAILDMLIKWGEGEMVKWRKEEMEEKI